MDSTTEKSKVTELINKGVDKNGKGRFNFKRLAKELGLDDETLDTVLNELEKERVINQYVLDRHDNFTIELIK
ncbi:hypothetical protein [Parapedobacter sp. DT-150]|uniref:hypothetical protein n=1 Tax=Parapedobacter sp. DT-150 TaxID=3396162 RepID=UPI003F19D06B